MSIVIYSELKEISKLIDSYSFIKNNKTDFSFCPETPIYTTDLVETQTENKLRIDKIIKDFCNKKGS